MSDNFDQSLNTNGEQHEVDSRGRVQKKAWYVLVVYPGRELKIRDKLIKLAENSPSLREQIFEVMVPTIKETNEKGKVKQTLIYTQYVYIEMILNDETYHAVKIDGVRHILGEPTPLTEAEIRNLFISDGRTYVSDEEYKIGDEVQIVDKELTLTHQICKVVEVDNVNKEVTVSIDLFGRETKTPHIRFDQIRKL